MFAHRTSRIALAGAAAVATLGLGAGAATAATTTPSTPTTPKTHAHAHGKQAEADRTVALPANPSLQELKAAAATDINNRVGDLGKADAKVAAAKYLGADQGTLETSLSNQINGLKQLGTKIAGDTDLATAQADYGTIFSGFRVYLLELPKTALVVTDDHITNAAGPRLTKEAAKIAAKETPANEAQVKPLLADLAAQVNSATAGVKGQAATLEGITPAAYDANHDVLKTERSSTKSARGDLKKAAGDAKQAATDVGLTTHHHKSGKKGATATTTPAA